MQSKIPQTKTERAAIIRAFHRQSKVTKALMEIEQGFLETEERDNLTLDEIIHEVRSKTEMTYLKDMYIKDAADLWIETHRMVEPIQREDSFAIH